MPKEKQSNLARFKDLGKGEFRLHLGTMRKPGCGGVAYWDTTVHRRGKKGKKQFRCTECSARITNKNHLGDKLDILRVPTTSRVEVDNGTEVCHNRSIASNAHPAAIVHTLGGQGGQTLAKKKKASSKPVEVEELDELEELEELADEEEEEEVEEEDEAEDEDEAPKKKAKKAKKKSSSGTIGSAELAEALGTSGRELRVMLRANSVKKNENNRYEWKSVADALEAMGFDDEEEAQEALAESRQKRLEELKDRVGKKDKKSKKKAKEEDSDDSDDEDEDDEEEEAPPKKKKKKKS